jgi:hypothetical protein
MVGATCVAATPAAANPQLLAGPEGLRRRGRLAPAAAACRASALLHCCAAALLVHADRCRAVIRLNYTRTQVRCNKTPCMTRL